MVTPNAIGGHERKRKLHQPQLSVARGMLIAAIGIDRRNAGQLHALQPLLKAAIIGMAATALVVIKCVKMRLASGTSSSAIRKQDTVPPQRLCQKEPGAR